jgi:hypothetical protein
MHMSPKLARSTLVELTQDCVIPIHPADLTMRGVFVRHGYVLVGDVALRGFKSKGSWGFDERDVRRAAQALMDLAVDVQDLVKVELPERQSGSDPGDWYWRTDWRRDIRRWMYNAAVHQAALDRRSRPPESYSRRDLGPNGLPHGLTLTQFNERAGDNTVATTKPLSLLSWSGEHWMLPRAYRDLLDRWEKLEKELRATARLCSSCGEQGPDNRDWRTPGTTEYVTVCPPCSASSHPAYAGHLHGVTYASLRSTHRASDYLCRLCKGCRASVWDHCHDHGYVRGPLCARCNGAEGSGRRFLDRDGSVLHLLQCSACHRERTLPRRYQDDVAAAHLEATERHGRCNGRPYIQNITLTDDGSTKFTISCHTHYTRKWTRELNPAEIADLVRKFLDSQSTDQP